MRGFFYGREQVWDESDIIALMWRYLISLASMIAVYYLHTYGMSGAYVQYWWLDIISHTLVCFAIAVFLGAFITSVLPALRWKMSIIIGITFFLGLLWEWLEVYYNITGHELWSTLYIQDTIQDFIMDTLGAAIGAYVSARPWTTKASELTIESIKIKNIYE